MKRNIRGPLFAACLALACPLGLFADDSPAATRLPDFSQATGDIVQAVKANKMLGVRRIEPGKGLEPAFSDPSRVKAILKLIEDVYYGRTLQFPKDGTVFANREGRLPQEPSGHYLEYTVMPPPGSPGRITVGERSFDIPPAHGTRGAERLIIGGGQVAYYSPDHYKTFIELTIVR